MSLTAYRSRKQSTVNDIRSCASAQETGAGIWPRSYDADFWSWFLKPVSGA